MHVAQAPQVHAEYHPVESRDEDVVQSSVDPSEGTRDELGRLVFDDAPDFRPTLTPKQVIQAGSFGGYDLMLYLTSFDGMPQCAALHLPLCAVIWCCDEHSLCLVQATGHHQQTLTSFGTLQTCQTQHANVKLAGSLGVSAA